MKEEKISIACKMDEDIDYTGSVRCDIFRNDRKIGDFNAYIDTDSGEFKMEIKGKNLIQKIMEGA